MKHLLLGIILGVGLAMVVQAAEQERMRDVAVTSAKGAAVVIPPDYGHLVSAVNKAEVQYLYFEAADGTVRIVLLGTGSALQQARTSLTLLTSDVYIMNRHQASPEPSAPANAVQY